MSDKINITHSVFHNDDVKLTLEYPDDLHSFTTLSKPQVASDFEAFARVLFDNILTKDKRNFKIVYNEEDGCYEVLTPME